MELRIFCDFDGTICEDDVGDAFFARYAPRTFATLRLDYLDHRLPARTLFDAYARELTLTDENELREFCRAYEPLPDFAPFVDWCAGQGITPHIVSDGLDAYIQEILARSNIRLPVHANHLERVAHPQPGEAPWRITLPWSDPECSDCGCCKRNRLMSASPDEAMAVVIGDGVTDFCAALHADLVFARGALETWCRERNITFRSFRRFSDIQRVLDDLMTRGRPRISREARVRRNTVWMRG